MVVCNVEQIVTGMEEAKQGNTLLGIQFLQDAAHTEGLPEARAWLGYCIAKEKGEFARGIALCKESLKKTPRSAEIYLALGRIYLLARKRALAIKTLEQGAKLEHSQEIHRLLQSIGVRKAPLFAFLSRKNLVNITSGRLLARIGLR
jgi:tetratricopeptide (TPR) repeat protein